ncbi:hypothetical protein GIB67_012747 [Kingdonia uniflora]|uniref:RNA helicase n=1 Tax=Kingdonia uniflora TaxID=39325 RepID=A0A7J7NFS3_9MAGN|nr:hypothetical protein GIB67_012747 [Kingdonia uniflora]
MVDEPINSIKKPKQKKVKSVQSSVDGDEEMVSAAAAVTVVKKVPKNPNVVLNFRISKPLRDMLKSRGIEALYSIQATTSNTILEGSNLVGPKGSRKMGYERAPSVLVLLPTRELVKHVYADCELYGGSLNLTGCSLYGGAPYRSQETSLKRGVDIIIGTPGRIKDHIQRGNIDFSSLKIHVLDKASKILKMRFLKPDKKTTDLVGNDKMEASNNVRHIVLSCSSSARSQLIPDIVRCYSDVEDYIYHSGRTGRAKNTGVAVMLYDPRRSNFSRIERESGVKFEHMSAPQPADITKAVGIDDAETIT